MFSASPSVLSISTDQGVNSVRPGQMNSAGSVSNVADQNAMITDNDGCSLVQTGDMITIQIPPTQVISIGGRGDSSVEILNSSKNRVKYNNNTGNSCPQSYYNLLYDSVNPICPPDFVINIRLLDLNMSMVSIKVHKVFLAVESQYFRTLINSEFTESANSQVEFELTSFEKEVFEQIILRYIYGDRVLTIDKGLPYACTLCLAHYLQMSSLECQLLQQMTKTAKYTQQHLMYYSQLINHTMLAVNSSFLSQSLIVFGKDIAKKRDEVLQLPVEFFVWLVSLDNLNVSNEDEVFDLVSEYFERNENHINFQQQSNGSDAGGANDSKQLTYESIWCHVRVPFLSEQKVLDFMDIPNSKLSTEFKMQLLRKRQQFAIFKEKFKRKALASKQQHLQQQQQQQQQQPQNNQSTTMSVETNSGSDLIKPKDDVTSSVALPAKKGDDLIIDSDDPQFIKRGNIIEYLITGSKGVIQIWDLNNNECLSTFPTDSFVRCLALYDRNYLLSGGHDKKIKKWNLRTNECELVLKGHSDYVLSFALVEDTLFSAGGVGDSTVRKWNLQTNQAEATLSGHQKAVLSLVAYRDMYIFSGGEDSTIRKWNVRTNQCEMVITASAQSDDKLWCLAIYEDHLFAGGSKGKIYQFNVDDGKCEMEWLAHENIVWCLLVHENYLYSGSKDKSIKKWNLTKKKDATDPNQPVEYECEAVFREHTDSVRSLSIYNNYLYSGGGDEKIVKWSLLNNQKEAVMTGEEYICSALLA